MTAARELAVEVAKKRALVIVNPYATTVSDWLRNLVVRALGARYEVEAIDTQAAGHATDICREARGSRGWPGRTVRCRWPGRRSLISAGRTNDCSFDLHPGRRLSAEHLLGLADRWAPRKVDLGRARAVLPRGHPRASVVRVDAHPAAKARFEPATSSCGNRHVHRRSSSGRRASRPGGANGDGGDGRPERPDYTYFNDRPAAASTSTARPWPPGPAPAGGRVGIARALGRPAPPRRPPDGPRLACVHRARPAHRRRPSPAPPRRRRLPGRGHRGSLRHRARGVASRRLTACPGSAANRRHPRRLTRAGSAAARRPPGRLTRAGLSRRPASPASPDASRAQPPPGVTRVA